MKTAELIENLITEIDGDSVTDEREDEVIDMLPSLRIKEAIETITDSSDDNHAGLSVKQVDFYKNIHSFLSDWAITQGEKFITRDIDDQINSVSGDETLITVRRIAQLLEQETTKANFSALVDEFSFIKNEGAFPVAGKHEHLRNIFE